MKRNPFLSWRYVGILLLATLAAAQTPHFRYERAILPSAGPNRIDPDVALMSGAASDLRDMRLFDASGREVPYIQISPTDPQPHWISGAILPVAATKVTSGFEVDLRTTSKIDRLKLIGMPTPFLKRFRLEGSGDRSRWTILIDEGTVFDLPDENLQFTEMPFTPGEYRYLRVTWSDRESGVVPQPRSVSARLVEPRGPAAPLRTTVEFQKLSAGPGRSRFQVRLPGPHLPLAAIELGVKEDRLLRSVRINEGRLSDGEVIPHLLGTGTLHRVVRGNLVASDTRIPIRPPDGREIEIVVDDDNNPPLNLTSVTIEFIPLPWIYFESRGAEQLTARYGDPRLTAPRYDLEAMRPYTEKTEVKIARWGDVHDSQPAEATSDTGLQPPVGAPLDRKPFRFSRPIPASPAGLTALLLDPAVLAHTEANLADLRIADDSDHQIQYLLERCEDLMSVDLGAPKPIPPDAKEKNRSRYTLTLPFEHLPPSKLVLATSERVFDRAISVQIDRPAADKRSEPGFETIAETRWRHADPDTPAPSLTMDLRSVGAKTITIVVDEGDNSPLRLTGARLDLPLYRMRFFYPANAKLTLLYGQPIPSPRYDLALLAPRLVGVSSRELALNQENAAAPAPEKTINATRIFWSALIVAVVALLVMLSRLLRGEART